MKIYRELYTQIQAGQQCALATLVRTSGSSPQHVGAKVLFLPDGRVIGTIGGGCMEAEARRVALNCLRKGTPALFDLRLDDDFGWDDGLICGGCVQIFINPFPERSALAYQAVVEAVERRKRAALCTIICGPEEVVGLSLLVGEDRSFTGAESVLHRPGFHSLQGLFPWEGESLGELCTFGLAGASSSKCGIRLLEVTQEALEDGRETVVNLEGGLSVYIEPILPRPTLLIAGAGHIGTALAQVGALCDFEVVVVDDRGAYANRERLPFADRIAVEDIPRFVREFPIDEDTYIVIVTRGHRHDAHVLRECIGSNAKYIGMIGSRRKICVIYEELLHEGWATKEQLRRVHSPLGLTLGDREVGEIAVSIAAELIAVRRGADLNTIRSRQYIPPFLRT
ncbi:MAG TPA: XdhC family protein [Chthonomonadales bacterium]|nr:XdhC family protein [Chthonomonadales bacterium]